MGLNIKNPEVERLVAEVALLTGESKTEVIRQSVLKRKEELVAQPRAERIKKLRKYLETEVWPKVPAGLKGKSISKAEREEILGIGPHGYCE